MPDLVTRRGVELAAVGTWECMTGEWTCTEADIADAVRAAADPSFRAPVIKLGHIDPRFDGEPAVGRVTNLRASADGTKLLGDLEGLPEWLDRILPSAFPSRSVEGVHDAVAASGASYKFVLTGLALLGVQPPAIESLADIASLYGVAAAVGERAPLTSGTPIVTVPAGLDVAAAADDGAYADPGYQADGKKRYKLNTVKQVRAAWSYINMPKNAKFYTAKQLAAVKAKIKAAAKRFDIEISDESVAAAVNVEDLRVAWRQQRNDRIYSWPREVWAPTDDAEPGFLVVEDDDGQLWRVAWSVDSDGAVAFEDPVPIRVSYVDAPEPEGQEPSLLARAPVHATAPPSPTTSKEEERMDPKKLREALGLATDATDEEVKAALKAKAADLLPAPEPAKPAEAEGEPTEGTTDQGGEAKPPALPEGVVAIDQATLEGLKVAAAAGQQAAQTLRTRDRDEFLGQAVRAGKFAPARLEHWRKAFDADEEGTRQVIASLAEGLVPVEGTEVGHTDAGASGADEAAFFGDLAKAGMLPAAIPTTSKEG